MSGMKHKLQQQLNKIDIPEQLHERSKKGVSQAKTFKKKRRPFISVGIAAVLFLTIVAFAFLKIEDEQANRDIPVTPISTADMIGLIVYNGNTYTQTDSSINFAAATALIGEKLGTTKATIDEWSDEAAYDEEFASTIGVVDVYEMKGYDTSFRIITYNEAAASAEIYEYIDEVTNVFTQLRITRRIESAKWRTYNDWNYSKDNYEGVADMDVLNTFVQQLETLTPIAREENVHYTDDNYRELTLTLADKTIVRLRVVKDGYVFYGYNTYYEVEKDVMAALWEQLQ